MGRATIGRPSTSIPTTKRNRRTKRTFALSDYSRRNRSSMLQLMMRSLRSGRSCGAICDLNSMKTAHRQETIAKPAGDTEA
jgi:hypothetical protein